MDQSQLNDKHFAAIGRLVVAVTRLDSLLTDLTAIFLRTDIVSAVTVFHHQQFASKVDSLKALLHTQLGDDPNLETVMTWIDEAKGVSDARNSLVHGHLQVEPDGSLTAIRFTARGRFRRSRQPYSVPEIERLVRVAQLVEAKLAAFRDSLLPPSVERSAPPTS